MIILFTFQVEKFISKCVFQICPLSDSSPISNSCMFIYLQDLDIADMVHTEAKLATRLETDYDIGLLGSLYIYIYIYIYVR